MALFSIPNIEISGISACVPSQVEYNRDYTWITDEERELMIKTTGIEQRRVANQGVTTGDLCEKAANRLIDELQWNREEIGVLIMITQGPDYLLPSTSIILQDRLGLNKSTIAFDVNLGCSGFVYGLSIVASLMKQSGMNKGLLLCGDVSTSGVSKKDKSARPIFGDAGTATALKVNSNAGEMHFSLNSDGKGHKTIYVPDGGLRNFIDENYTFNEKQISNGIVRHGKNIVMDGAAVFNFTNRVVARSVQELLTYAKTSTDLIDFLVLHQANKIMNERIRKKLGLPTEKVPYSLKRFGNTSSASIPLTIITELEQKLQNGAQLMLSGFGVGLSWANAHVKMSNTLIVPLIEME